MPPPHTPTAPRPRTPLGTRVAYAMAVTTTVSALLWAGLVLTHLKHPTFQNIQISSGMSLVILGLGLALPGTAFVARGSGRSLGHLLVVSGCLLVLQETLWALIYSTGTAPGTAVHDAAKVIGALSFNTFGIAFLTIPMWLPYGRLPGRGGQAYVVAVALYCAMEPAAALYNALRPHPGVTPYDHSGWARVADLVPSWLLDSDRWIALLCVTVSMSVMVVRWLRSPAAKRTYWGLAIAYFPWVTVVFFDYFASYGEVFHLATSFLAALFWPMALSHIHVSHRTGALTSVPRRILTALLLTYLMFVVYGACGILLSFAAPTARTPAAQLLAALAAATTALLRPTHRWAVRVVDHYYYGERAQPYQAVRELADRLGHAVDPGDAPRLLCDTVVHTLGLPAAALVVHTRNGTRELARLGTGAPSPGETFPLVYQGEEIGHLLVPPRPGTLALDQQDREAVRVLADHGAPALASLRLYEDLQASREQIVLAREEERRKLRHDLHDGLGPTLSGLRLQVDAVRSRLTGHADADPPLRTVSTGIGHAIEELRHITNGLAPAALDGADLPRALHQLAGHLGARTLRITVALHPDPLPRLPAAVEVAVYRIAAEALHNAVRHSRATHARLSVEAGEEAVVTEVRDDGEGMPTHRPGRGVGLRSMAERAEELGGRLTLTSTTDGTLVRAVIPRTPTVGDAGGGGPGEQM